MNKSKSSGVWGLLVVITMFITIFVVWDTIRWLSILCIVCVSLFVLLVAYSLGRLKGEDDTLDMMFENLINDEAKKADSVFKSFMKKEGDLNDEEED